MIKSVTFFSAVTTAALLGGCVNLNYDLSTVEGEATRQNFAAQVVDPTPAEGAPVMDAEMADAAAERHRNDEVKEPFAEEGGTTIGLSFSPE